MRQYYAMSSYMLSVWLNAMTSGGKRKYEKRVSSSFLLAHGSKFA